MRYVVLRIRIRIGFGVNQVSESGLVIQIRIQAGKMTHRNRKKLLNIFEVLDVLL
jgi:hypothetical protein